ncbi:hypothetical protein ACQR1Y_12670 [Bradyrhizobium sp. HKCCYLRH3099]|uniref:hypothetical protein n=1 Tax=unclassified Bradyrhizobium TaxID=2631580 RepID=UPI003EB87636
MVVMVMVIAHGAKIRGSAGSVEPAVVGNPTVARGALRCNFFSAGSAGSNPPQDVVPRAFVRPSAAQAPEN